MFLSTILVFGHSGSGKTQLLTQMLNAEGFQTNHKPTGDIRYHVGNRGQTKLQFWDCSGNPRYTDAIAAIYYPQTQIALYCVDLSSAISEAQIRQDIERFREANPLATIILVGTKVEQAQAESQGHFDRLEIAGVKARLKTSAATGLGLNTLEKLLLFLSLNSLLAFTHIYKIGSVWQEATHNLLLSIYGLPDYQREAIRDELNILTDAIHHQAAEHHAEAITRFTRNCCTILEGNHPYIMHAVFSVGAAAIVTILAITVGFGVGFTAGLWTGPGAFITAVMASETAAGAVLATSSSLGLIRGGLTAHGLFKEFKQIRESQEMGALNNFVATSRDYTPALKD
ncbi:GTPase domain-containing protein [Legionella sp. 29fVS95]|uniref:GTPase domain-containing protein n=1 Tax=Legionella sp. 29fVS95 TaxID=3402813 RepID=UPI003AF64F2B